MRAAKTGWTVVAAACLLAGSAAPALGHGDEGDRHDATTGPVERVGRYVPKAPGTREDLTLYFGPYAVPPGWDANRVDVDLPLRNGFIVSVNPSMRRVEDLSEPPHQEGHIHHAHWFGVDPGNAEDDYIGHTHEWIFGNGDEETKADFQPRTDAEPDGPIYGQYIPATQPQTVIYMLHNKTARMLNVYIALDVTFIHGTAGELERITGRAHNDVAGKLFGRTFDVPRDAAGDGIWETARDDPRGVIEWVSTIEGTIIGSGGHLHQGGIGVVAENYGSESAPCPATRGGYGGTLVFRSDAVFRHGLWSEDFQMTVTDPAWRAPIRKGDRIRISGTYENAEHGWYDVMTHEGFYVDPTQPPREGCSPYFVGEKAKAAAEAKRKLDAWRKARRRERARARARAKARRDSKSRRRSRAKRRSRARSRSKQRSKSKKRSKSKQRSKSKRRKKGARRPSAPPDPTVGVANRPWAGEAERFCGEEFGGPPCERPEPDRGSGVETSTVAIANFLYLPGDRTLSGPLGAPPRVKRGTGLSFVNLDQPANVRHSVTTCASPCNGAYVANYPLPDGAWDSETLGYDPVDGGTANPVATTPKDLAPRRYAYFCRIHPWMRGAFEVVE